MRLNQKQYDELNSLESWLYNYKSIKVGIENLKLECEESKIATLGSTDPSTTSCTTHKFSSNVENAIINYEQLEKKVKFMESEMGKIEKALSSLSKEEFTVIDNFYIQGKHIYEFTHEIGNSERSCRRIKERAIKKIKIALYGVQIKN